MTTKRLTCPSCSGKILHKSENVQRLRLHGPIDFAEDGTATARCYWCKSLLELPISLTELKPRFVIRTNSSD